MHWKTNFLYTLVRFLGNDSNRSKTGLDKTWQKKFWCFRLRSPQHLLFVKFDKPQLIGKSKLSKRKKIKFFNSLFDFERFLVLLLTSQGNWLQLSQRPWIFHKFLITVFPTVFNKFSHNSTQKVISHNNIDLIIIHNFDNEIRT